MVAALATLLLCQLAGELSARALGAPLPGPVLGMLLLLLVLLWRGGPPEPLARAADGLLGALSLLFVPAGAGIMLHAGRIAEEWAAVLAAVVGSTALALLVTAATFRLVSRLAGARPDA